MTVWKRRPWALLWAATALCVAKDCRNHISIVGVEGEDTVLSPLVAGNGHLTRIDWKKRENIVASSWLNFPPAKEKQRLSLDSSSGNLFLKNLSKEDTGNYTADIFINEKIEVVCFDLKILERPDINCIVNNDTIQLNCTSASQDLLLRYSWDYIRNEEMIYVKDSVVQLPKNSKRFQKITCYVTVFNSSANNSINWSDCNILEEEPDHQLTHIVPAISVLIIAIVVALVVICYGSYITRLDARMEVMEAGLSSLGTASRPAGVEAQQGLSRQPVEADRCQSTQVAEASSARLDARMEVMEAGLSLLGTASRPAGVETQQGLSRQPVEVDRCQSTQVAEASSENRQEKSKENDEPESGARNASANCKEESSELSEDESKLLTGTKLESLGGKEKSEESSESSEDESKPLTGTKLESLGGKEKSEETSRLES